MKVLIPSLILIAFSAVTLWTQFPRFFKKKPSPMQKKIEPYAVIGLILSVIVSRLVTW